jgi:choline dehydrogenase
MIDSDAERAQSLLEALERGVLTRRRFLELLRAAGLSAAVGSSAIAAASAAGSNQSIRRRSLKSGYDYIVVGAGAAGCIIAAALAGAGAEVLLLEAGGTDELPQVNTPGLWFTNIGTSLDWRFTAEPSPSVDERRVPIAMGHVLGGGTSINAMLWVRGLASDFDHWAGAGCAGWGFSDILPLYKRIEDWQGGANEWRGAGGPVPIRTAQQPHPTANAFLASCKNLGIPILEDVNGPMREGAGLVNMTITPQGTRANASRCFLRPKLALRNLTLLLDTSATRLLFEGARCRGVRTRSGNAHRDFTCTREVIVTCGGIGSAKLLMLSGLGEAQSLRALGITPVVDLPGVGRNFQDHPLLCGVVFQYRGAMPPRSSTSNAVEAAAYVRSRSEADGPDIKMVLQQLPLLTPELRRRFPITTDEAFTISPALVRPTSRGTLKLRSANSDENPRLEANFLATDEDLRATVRCIEMTRELGSQAGFAEVRDRELVPGRPLDRAALEDFARLSSISFGHPVGTCRMGLGTDAVVDPQLRVHGVRGLRVADSSIMPRIITGPTSAPTHAIALKAADLLLQDARPGSPGKS